MHYGHFCIIKTIYNIIFSITDSLFYTYIKQLLFTHVLGLVHGTYISNISTMGLVT